jgi:hypothetical protein
MGSSVHRTHVWAGNDVTVSLFAVHCSHVAVTMRADRALRCHGPQIRDQDEHMMHVVVRAPDGAS